MSCPFAVTIDRNALHGIRWKDSDAPSIINAAAREQLVNQKGRARELYPIDLAKEPNIAALLQSVDLETMVADA
jgi:hypothetical protein